MICFDNYGSPYERLREKFTAAVRGAVGGVFDGLREEYGLPDDAGDTFDTYDGGWYDDAVNEVCDACLNIMEEMEAEKDDIHGSAQADMAVRGGQD